jgi:hypothetical protein
MWRQSVRWLGVYTALCMSVSSATANDIYPHPLSLRGIDLDANYINLYCSVEPDPTRWGEQPNIATHYRINLNNSEVNGEILRIDRIDTRDELFPGEPKIAWNRAAEASIPAAHYILDLRSKRLAVSFDPTRSSANTALHLRCINPRINVL